MAHFYGSMQGARGEATRCGTKASGISAHIRGWNVGVRVSCYVDGNGRDVIEVRRTAGSNGGGMEECIATFVEGEATRLDAA